MKPITTWKELGEMEVLFRSSERARIAAWLRSAVVSFPESTVTLERIAMEIEDAHHWRTRDHV